MPNSKLLQRVTPMVNSCMGSIYTYLTTLGVPKPIMAIPGCMAWGGMGYKGGRGGSGRVADAFRPGRGVTWGSCVYLTSQTVCIPSVVCICISLSVLHARYRIGWQTCRRLCIIVVVRFMKVSLCHNDSLQGAGDFSLKGLWWLQDIPRKRGSAIPGACTV